jgi:zinc/manganese transport system substrate-binding protein
VLSRLRGAVSEAPRLRVDAVGSTPLVEYAVEWMGVRLLALVSPGPGSAVTVEGLVRARGLLSSRARLAVAATVAPPGCAPASPADEKLVSMARARGVPVLCVPAPFLPSTTLEKIERVAAEAARLAEEGVVAG